MTKVQTLVDSEKKKQIVKLKIHTVILLVGPSACGKSFFSKNYLIPSLLDVCKLPWRAHTNIQYLSSDACRRELLGGEVDYDKNTPQMMAVSEQAFDLLHKKLELVTSYPVNAEFVIVDTTGLNAAFRDKVTKAAKKANYNTCCVVFDYKNRDDYYKHLDDKHDLGIISAQLKRLRQETFVQLKKRDFDSFLYIKKKDFSNLQIEVEDAEEYQDHFLPTHLEYPIIGDIHGCYDELIEMLAQLRFKVENDLIVDKPSAKFPIIVGDFIDGDLVGVEKVINFFYANREHFKFVKGNHEHFVYRYHKKDLAPGSLPPMEVITSYFPTTKLLEEKPDIAEKFCVLHGLSKDFYVGFNFIVTHAPCEESALGKMSLAALRQQRNFRYPQKQEGEDFPQYSFRFENALSFLKQASAMNKPYHIFGHCRVKNVARTRNKIGIDTGVAQGNRLTAASVVGNKVYFTCVQSKQPKTEDLPEVFTRKDAATEILPDVDLNALDNKELGRIKWAAKHKVNYISGTMSPTDKDLNKMKLETVEKALEYFKSKDVDSVVLQKKYMGSRAELFLNCKDISQSYTTTRRGHLIDYIDLTKAYPAVLAKVGAWAAEQEFEWLLLDCELMPWYALGKGLIMSQYAPCQTGIGSELALLKETVFDCRIQNLIDESKNVVYGNTVGYAHLSSQLPKEQLRKILTPHKCAAYEALRGFQWIPLEQQEEYFSVYKRQLELFATEGEIHFKPFAILKGIKFDGSEQLFFDMPNSEQFQLVSDDECLVVDLSANDALERAEEFFNRVVDMELEGIVVKPQIPYIKDVAPYLKVRSEKYLTIIYNYDFLYPAKYEKLVRQKRIDRKLQTSMDEFVLGKRMLEIPRESISMENEEYVRLFARMIFEEKKEERFDPRL